MKKERSWTGRPERGEFADYAASDIDAVPGGDAVLALVQLESETRALFESLRALVDGGTTYAPGKWTLKEVLGHIIDDERIFACRILCVARGEAAALPGFDEKSYVAAADFESRTLSSLLQEYATLRAATVSMLENLPEASWGRRGCVNGYAASPRGLAFHIAGHELHHHRVIRDRYLPLLDAS
ncbi:MAG: DinB family protein [Gemmatimonadales bacterium]